MIQMTADSSKGCVLSDLGGSGRMFWIQSGRVLVSFDEKVLWKTAPPPSLKSQGYYSIMSNTT